MMTMVRVPDAVRGAVDADVVVAAQERAMSVRSKRA